MDMEQYVKIYFNHNIYSIMILILKEVNPVLASHFN